MTVKKIKENISSMFEDVVKKHTSRIALIQQARKITYNELDTLSSQLANFLKKSGVEKNTSVGIYLPRSIETIISMLAILKSGAYYVPLSTELCETYIESLVEHANIPFIISSSEKIFKTNPVIIDIRSYAETENSQKNNLDFTSDAEDIGYIIFTSGTTGMPKGVTVLQKSIINLVKNQSYVEITEKDVLLQLSPIEFDGSTFEIWGALLNGATLSLMPPGYPELSEIARQLTKNGISILFITTQLFNSMVDLRLSSLLSIKQILFGGEAASISHVNKLLSHKSSDSKLINMYGPTECTTFSTYHLINSNASSSTIPIGKPINNVVVFVLNKKNQLVDHEEEGELHIGGLGVASGYLNDKMLTNSKFITNLFQNSSSEKLFKTNDIVRKLKNGDLEFIGRNDRLVKIRGHRVSLESVESELRKYENIESVAVHYNEENSEKKLIAWIQTSDPGFNIQNLKSCLRKKISNHMIPNVFNIVDKLPVTINGKINYSNLIRQNSICQIKTS